MLLPGRQLTSCEHCRLHSTTGKFAAFARGTKIQQKFRGVYYHFTGHLVQLTSPNSEQSLMHSVLLQAVDGSRHDAIRLINADVTADGVPETELQEMHSTGLSPSPG